jgi:hypothetical protein
VEEQQQQQRHQVAVWAKLRVLLVWVDAAAQVAAQLRH